MIKLISDCTVLTSICIPVNVESIGATASKEFDIQLENAKLPVIDKICINDGFLFKKAVCCNSRQ